MGKPPRGVWKQYFDLLEEADKAGVKKVDKGLFRDVIWLSDIDDPYVLEIIRGSLRKWIDGIVNFAHYIIRKLQYYGVLIDAEDRLMPTSDGYSLIINFHVVGMRGDVAKDVIRKLRRIARGKTDLERKLERILELLARLGYLEEEGEGGEPGRGKAGDSSSSSSGEEAEEDSVEVELVS